MMIDRPEYVLLRYRGDLSPGYLAMECLLILTSRRSGEWFKEELREVGGVRSIMDSIIGKPEIIIVNRVVG